MLHIIKIHPKVNNTQVNVTLLLSSLAKPSHFTVSDIGGDHLPKGRSVDEEGYFQLETKNYHDNWEIRAGCLIRHHLQPWHPPHDITKIKDCPLELKQLDPVRVTLMRLPNSIRQITTDRHDTLVPASKSAWTGVTTRSMEQPGRSLPCFLHPLRRKWHDRPNMQSSRRSALQSSMSET